MKEITIIKYQTEDGEQFDTKAEAEKLEELKELIRPLVIDLQAGSVVKFLIAREGAVELSDIPESRHEDFKKNIKEAKKIIDVYKNTPFTL